MGTMTSTEATRSRSAAFPVVRPGPSVGSGNRSESRSSRFTLSRETFVSAAVTISASSRGRGGRPPAQRLHHRTREAECEAHRPHLRLPLSVRYSTAVKPTWLAHFSAAMIKPLV